MATGAMHCPSGRANAPDQKADPEATPKKTCTGPLQAQMSGAPLALTFQLPRLYPLQAAAKLSVDSATPWCALVGLHVELFCLTSLF
eukprot:175884-Pelagomonas_calceolata.AAC.2